MRTSRSRVSCILSRGRRQMLELCVHDAVIAPSPIYLPLYLPTEANAVHTHTSAPYSSVHQLLLREAALNCTVCADWASQGGGYRIKAIATSTVTKWLFCLWLWSLPICYKLNHDSMKKSLTDTGNKNQIIFNIFPVSRSHFPFSDIWPVTYFPPIDILLECMHNIKIF